LVFVSLLGLLLASPASQAEEKKSRTTTSANGEYTVHLVEVTEDPAPLPEAPKPKQKAQAKTAPKPVCKVQVETEAGPAWSFPQCVGDADDLYFVSNDGERIWVLHPLPAKPRGNRGWLGAKVATLVDRRSGVVGHRQLYEFVPKDGRDDVRLLGRHVQWLEGMFGMPGVPPRLSAAGTLEFETAGGKKRVLPFR
jgi:hypothetical protein